MLPYLIAGAIGFGIGKLFENGGETFMAGGRITTNEDVLNSFLTSSKEVKVNNLSTHFNEYDDFLLLRNYYTLIATRKGNDVKITNVKHSKTTSAITNRLKALAEEMGYNVSYVSKFENGGETFMAGGMTNEDIIFEYPKDSNGRVMSWINVGTGNMEIASKTGTVGQVRDGHQLIVLKSETPNKVDYHILVDYLPEENKINMVRGKFNSEPSPKYQSYINDLFRMLKISQKTRDYQDEDIANQVYVKRYLINNFGNPPKGCEIKAKELGVEIHFDSTNKMSSDWAMKIADKYGYPSGNFEMRYSSGNVPITYVDTSKIAKNTSKSEKGYINFGETFMAGGRAGKNFYWITMDRNKIDEYIGYASRMYGMFEGQIYTQAPNKVAFDSQNDMFAFTSMIDNHNNDNDFQEGDEGYIHYEELFNGEPRPNIFDRIIGGKYTGGGEIKLKIKNVDSFDKHYDEVGFTKKELSLPKQDSNKVWFTTTNDKSIAEQLISDGLVEKYAGGGKITDADLNYYIYPNKIVKIAYLGKIQMGYFFSLKDALKEIEYLTMAYPKNEIEKYAIITPDKTFHLGEKEYNIRFENGGGVEYRIGGEVDKELTIEQTRKIAQETANSLGTEFSVTKNTVDVASFDLDLNGEEFEGGSYLIMKNGDVLNVALPNNPVYYNYKERSKNPKMIRTIFEEEYFEDFDNGGEAGEIEKPYQVYNYDTQNVEGYFDNEIEAEEFASQFKNATIYDIREYAGGGGVGSKTLTRKYLQNKGRNVFTFGYGMPKDAIDKYGTIGGTEYFELPNGDVYKKSKEDSDKFVLIGNKSKMANGGYTGGGGVDDYIEEQVKQFNTDKYVMRKQYGKENIKDIEYQGFLAIDENNENYERLSDYEFEGEEFDRDNLLEVAKKYPQADYITFHARLMGESDFGIEDELSPIDDLAMEFDMARLNQFANGGVAKKRRRSASVQYGRSNTAVDKTRPAKPVGYRFTDEKATELNKETYDIPTESEVKKYLGKGIYKENRKRHSDKDRNAKL